MAFRYIIIEKNFVEKPTVQKTSHFQKTGLLKQQEEICRLLETTR